MRRLMPMPTVLSPGNPVSNDSFIRYLSTALIAFGATGLILGISCLLFPWAYCESDLIPILVQAPEELRMLLQVNLPASLLLMGLALRQYTTFGWFLSVLMLTVLTGFFTALTWFHTGQGKLFTLLANPALISPVNSGWVVSFFIDLLITLSCAFGLLFLSLKPIRTLYFENGFLFPKIEKDSPEQGNRT